MRRLTALALGAILMLVGCSGDSRGPTAPAEIAPALVESESGSLVNELRLERQLDLVSFDPLLADIARAHSEAMRDRGFLGHSGPSGQSLRARLRAAGVAFRSAGENLAQVQSAPNPAGEAHAQLLESPGHRENMLDPRFRLVGVGVASEGDTYWITQILLEP